MRPACRIACVHQSNLPSLVTYSYSQFVNARALLCFRVKARMYALTAWTLLGYGLLSLSAAGQTPSPPDFRITPSVATMIIGEQRSFELNGADGRPIPGASWEAKGPAVDLLSQDPPTVAARNPGAVTLSATRDGRYAETHITVIADKVLPPGTVQWSVEPLPGMKTSNIVQAVRISDSTPDLYTNESGPSGRVVRAFHSDGREMWRWGGDPQKIPRQADPIGTVLTKPPVTAECRQVKSGMSKGEIKQLFGAKLSLSADEYTESRWRIEGQPMNCWIEFNPETGLVTQRKFLASEPE